MWICWFLSPCSCLVSACCRSLVRPFVSLSCCWLCLISDLIWKRVLPCLFLSINLFLLLNCVFYCLATYIMQLFFIMPFQQRVSTSMGLLAIWNLQLLKTLIHISFLTHLYWHRVETKALSLQQSLTIWGSHDEQDTEEMECSWEGSVEWDWHVSPY